jgi:hypothetical protein
MAEVQEPELSTAPGPAASTSSRWDKVLTMATVFGLSVLLVPPIVAALADPKLAAKLALAGLTALRTLSALLEALQTGDADEHHTDVAR